MRCFENTRYMQYAAAIIATLSIPSGTIYTSWLSPTLPILNDGDVSPLDEPLSSEEESWIASIQALATIPAGLATFFVIEKVPRKYFLLFTAAMLFFPWIVCIFANSASLLIGARFVGGFGNSFAQILVPIYVGEIAEKDIRGRLGALFNILKLIGSLVVYSIGPFVSYIVLCVICSIFPLLFFILFCFMPESPYYLVKVNKHAQAEKNLAKLSSNATTLKSNIDIVVNTVNFDMQNKSSIKNLLLGKQYRKSFLIMLSIKTFQQFSGMNAIDAYMQSIIKLSGSSISPEISSVICGVVQIPAALFAAYLVDKVGRKPLWIISSIGCSIALLAEGVYFYLQDVLHTNLDAVSWLPTAALMFYLIMNPIGLFTVPYIIMGELFATNIKDTAASISVTYGGALTFIFLKFFKPLSELWGIHVMFGIFSVGTILGAIFVYFVLPETKGKTFLEIQEMLHSAKKVKRIMWTMLYMICLETFVIK